jgi:integrase
LKLKETRRRDEMRDGFTLADLEAMFVKSPEYAEGKLKSPDQFWIPLLSLFSGARLEELCQLHTDQVAQDQGIWSLIIEEKHKGQSVKTSERRVIPLHPFLIDGLGFHKWAQEQKRGRLWPNLKRINDRWGHYFGRWFGRFWRKCGLKGKLGFHSFRHTVETELREANVEGIWIDMLTGHSISGEGGGRYTKRNTKTILERAVRQLKWNEKLDLSGLKGSKWAR